MSAPVSLCTGAGQLTLHRLLLAKRIAKGLTQTDLAKEIGVKRLTLIRWEQAKFDPPFPKMMLWAKALDIEIVLATSILGNTDDTSAAGGVAA